MERKPTLLQLRRFYNITSAQLAQAAGVPLYQSYTVEVGGYTSRHIAERVLHAFSWLVKRRVTLNDVHISFSIPIEGIRLFDSTMLV
ncbi:MAG TPA: hypothetical protein VL461_09590 [Dictyobacter sp.]|jgi:hypothetical protein|nr:hypothetical protein [Dictyobacter sp.]